MPFSRRKKGGIWGGYTMPSEKIGDSGGIFASSLHAIIILVFLGFVA